MNGEVWLYGSVARCSYDQNSDLDVLVVGDFAGSIRALTANLPRSEYLSIRKYDWGSVEAMAEYGSLFLLHLKNEGKRLAQNGDRSLQPLLQRLPAYKRSRKDVAGFLATLDDVDESLNDSGDVAFELSVIASVLRHASILACYQLGDPAFDREASIRRAFEAFDLGEHAQGAIEMYKFRLAKNRSIPVGGPATRAEACIWSSIARLFVARVGEVVGE